MISIIRTNSSPEMMSRHRIIDALNGDFSESLPYESSIKKFIIVKKIEPKEYDEDYGVEDMTKNEKSIKVNGEDLDAIEAEIPPEVDEFSDNELDDVDDFEEEDDDIEVSEEDLDDIETEIPPEVDKFKDIDLPDDIDIDIDDEKDIDDYLW